MNCHATNTSFTNLVHRIHWGDASGWVAGIGTVATLAFAAWRYFVNVHRQQANSVTSWVVSNNGRTAWHAIKNSSDNPVYEVIVSLVSFTGGNENASLEYKALVSVVPPGTYYVRTHGNTGMHFHPGSEIAFKDVRGKSWLRKGDGSLKGISQAPPRHYGLSFPIGWTQPNSKDPTV
ncbi:MAG TPA: hypothetical protein VLI54_04370 [Bacillota bacterium]|nr:hypothetical protein [Bacillota bacterium]